ncbi:MAG: hypothetical protein Q6362_009770 [Candidatus Wukongarchaeota archaeon]|nr:hypothetical protein [Candidatus Wukongarchaeota archaeon]
MGKTEEMLEQILEKIDEMAGSIQKFGFVLVQIASKLDEVAKGGGFGVKTSVQTVDVDLSPIEERLEEIAKETVKKQDFEELRSEVDKLVGGKVKEAEETVKKATSLLERGLELVDLESSLFDVKTYLEEMILEKKALEEIEEKE